MALADKINSVIPATVSSYKLTAQEASGRPKG